MYRVLLWTSTTVGLFLFTFGLLLDRTSMWAVGLTMIIVCIALGLRPGGILRREQVLDRWGIMIESAQDNADKIFQDTEERLKQSKAPSLKIEMRDMSPSVIKKVLGTKRRFLFVVDQKNIKLRPYQIFINARNYGNNLDINWYFTFRPSIWQSLLSFVPYTYIGPKNLNDLDLFEQQDLIAYTTNVHHCLLDAVEKLKLELNQDTSKIDRKSKGFLGIS